MEYTKDVIFDIQYAGETKKFRKRIYKIFKENKFIISILFLFITLTTIDIVLINSFLKILVNY